MATINKNFKVKHGLVVEGTTGTIDGIDILTKKQADQDYIIDLVGGSGTSNNTPDTLVLRDGSGNFSAGTITADLTGDVTGTVSDISNHTTDSLAEGVNNEYYTDAKVRDVLTGATKTNIQITEIGNELHITAENGVADSTTDDLAQGTINKYYSDTLVDNHLSGGTGIEYTTGTINAKLGAGLETDLLNQIQIDRTIVDGYYDANGAAATVQTNLDNHELDTSTHGVTGNIVGTTDVQDLSNKRIIDTLNFSDGVTIANEGEIAILSVSHEFEVKANNGDLSLKTVATGADVNIASQSGDIILNPDGGAYVSSVSAANEIATHGYVDNAVSGLAWKEAVHLLYNDPTPTLTGDTVTSPLIIDGHAALGAGDAGYRILVAYSVADSGIYVYNVAGTTWTLDRALDADTFEELVGAAVYVMEGTQYGGTSWVQGEHYLTSFTGQTWTQFSGSGTVTAGTGITVNGLEVSVDFSTVASQTDLSTGLSAKQNTLTAGSNINIDGSSVISVTGLASTDISDFSTAAVDANTGLWDTAGSAYNAQLNAEGYTDAQLLSYTTTANLETTIDGYGFAYSSEIPLTTDDLPEGVNNHYYTDALAKAEAAALLTNATTENIQITYANGVLDIVAENGVADSTTFDLDEDPNGSGTSGTWYFTNQRAVDALEAVVPNFTAIEVDGYAKQIAANLFITTPAQETAYAFDKTIYRSAKLLIKCAYGTHTELTEVLLTLDSSDNIAITEYATVGTNGSTMSVTADILGTVVRILVHPVNANSDVTVYGTLLK